MSRDVRSGNSAFVCGSGRTLSIIPGKGYGVYLFMSNSGGVLRVFGLVRGLVVNAMGLRGGPRGLPRGG